MEKLKFGAYSLTLETINSLIDKRIGNYELGYRDQNCNFVQKYVGRSDHDLNSRLKDHIGEYSEFKYSYAESIWEAYLTELEDYNKNWMNLDNKIFPDRPDGCDIWAIGQK